jgi:hypothetical protein
MKIKVVDLSQTKPSCCIKKAQVNLHAFSILALDGGDWSASRSGLCTHEEKPPSSLWKGEWLSSKRGLDSAAKKNEVCISSFLSSSMRAT